jgi:prepilin-type N-terminal cleavage/methylation domain-containing protein
MSSSRGYSLVEVLVVLGLLSVVMLGAGGLIISSMQLSDRAVRSIRAPDVTVAMLAVRRDVQLGVGLTAPVTFGWTEQPLVVRQENREAVAYGWDGDALRRWTLASDGGSSETSVVVRGVTGWRWRWAGGAAVDIELETVIEPRVSTGTGDTARETWRFAMRGTRAAGW